MTEFAAEWDRCKPWLEAALAHAGTHELDDVKRAIATGDAQFWPGRGCAAVTEIITYPRLTVLHCWLAGGDMKEVLQMTPDIEAWGAARGCSRFTVEGRLGWGRVLSAKGYAAVSTTIAKELTQ